MGKYDFTKTLSVSAAYDEWRRAVPLGQPYDAFRAGVEYQSTSPAINAAMSKANDDLWTLRARTESAEAEVARLREALERIDKHEINPLSSMVNNVFLLKNSARAALAKANKEEGE